MYRVQLQEFEGPLDLLLFFIKRDELDIYDIPISKITDEYLSYVRILEQIDLDSVGDFIYMAAQLINIKAKMLLPSKEMDEEGEPIDPRRELVQRLLNYMKYKEAAFSLQDKYEERGDYFIRTPSTEDRDTFSSGDGAPNLDVSVFSLISALQRVLTEVPEAPTHAVHRNQYTLESQRQYIWDHLTQTDRISFTTLIKSKPKHFVIVTFLVLLEMAQRGRVYLMVNAEGDDFMVEQRTPEPEITEGGEMNGVSGAA